MFFLFSKPEEALVICLVFRIKLFFSMISYRVGFVFNKLYFILLLLFCILKAYSRSLAHIIF